MDRDLRKIDPFVLRLSQAPQDGLVRILRTILFDLKTALAGPRLYVPKAPTSLQSGFELND